MEVNTTKKESKLSLIIIMQVINISRDFEVLGRSDVESLLVILEAIFASPQLNILHQ